jgi:DNA-binding transcriptional MerR regulator
MKTYDNHEMVKGEWYYYVNYLNRVHHIKCPTTFKKTVIYFYTDTAATAFQNLVNEKGRNYFNIERDSYWKHQKDVRLKEKGLTRDQILQYFDSGPIQHKVNLLKAQRDIFKRALSEIDKQISDLHDKLHEEGEKTANRLDRIDPKWRYTLVKELSEMNRKLTNQVLKS